MSVTVGFVTGAGAGGGGGAGWAGAGCAGAGAGAAGAGAFGVVVFRAAGAGAAWAGAFAAGAGAGTGAAGAGAAGAGAAADSDGVAVGATSVVTGALDVLGMAEVSADVLVEVSEEDVATGLAVTGAEPEPLDRAMAVPPPTRPSARSAAIIGREARNAEVAGADWAVEFSMRER